MRPIEMVDLVSQHARIREELDTAIKSIIDSAEFIQGQAVRSFEQSLSRYLGGTNVISCGNGTDALQIAMMALNFRPGDEVIIPVHTYVATAEAIALLGLVPVFVDVYEDVFTIDISSVEQKITPKTVAIIPVHLYGQCANMEPLLRLAASYGLAIIEDTAQSLGASYTFSTGKIAFAGTMGTIGTTSFFPSKNLGGFGDGGALFTDDDDLAKKLRMIANHGQQVKYRHDLVGINSRLDTIQAAVLEVKLRHLESFVSARQKAAEYYDQHLLMDGIKLPRRAPYSSHVFHQYTLRVLDGNRDRLQQFLRDAKVPTMIYYPVPLHRQPAYVKQDVTSKTYPVSEFLSSTVLSLPMHTEMRQDQLSYICEQIHRFYLL
ncbi:MAG TPA: DegT/DnrJ/EryC1/StrS family aminotransferase [Cyclobacteriaceae bacterium]|nr:DegT/DnrJ/EryC1/StrS family aminotransferase [Cyclobacteriaceae bacterium]